MRIITRSLQRIVLTVFTDTATKQLCENDRNSWDTIEQIALPAVVTYHVLSGLQARLDYLGHLMICQKAEYDNADGQTTPRQGITHREPHHTQLKNCGIISISPGTSNTTENKSDGKGQGGQSGGR